MQGSLKEWEEDLFELLTCHRHVPSGNGQPTTSQHADLFEMCLP